MATTCMSRPEVSSVCTKSSPTREHTHPTTELLRGFNALGQSTALVHVFFSSEHEAELQAQLKQLPSLSGPARLLVYSHMSRYVPLMVRRLTPLIILHFKIRSSSKTNSQSSELISKSFLPRDTYTLQPITVPHPSFTSVPPSKMNAEHPTSATPSSATKRIITLQIGSYPLPYQRPDTYSMSVDTAPIRQSSIHLSMDTSYLPSDNIVMQDQPQHTTKKISRAQPSCSKIKSCCEINSHKRSKSSPSYRVEKKHRNQSQLSDNIRSPPDSKDAVPRWVPSYDPPTHGSQRKFSLERFLQNDVASCVVDLGNGQLNISQPRCYLASLAKFDVSFPN